MARNEQQLLDEVNRSGFPLQIGVERLVRDGASQLLDWKVRYTEHEYEHTRLDGPGFIDLVIRDDTGQVNLVVECKRVQETSWVFLRRKDAPEVTRAKVLVAYAKDGRKLYGWEDLDAKLSSPESEYCSVVGDREARGRTLLERVGAGVIMAAEGLAAEDQKYGLCASESAYTYVPIIVTTAEIKLADYAVSAIALASGTLTDATFVDVPFVRFRKQLSARPSIFRQATDRDPGVISRAKESTIFVVQVQKLMHFLRYFEITGPPVNSLLPRS